MTAAYNYFHVTNFFWMFGEGCYLHTAIVLTYSTDRLRKWMFICIGWGERASPRPDRAILPPPRPGPAHWGLRPRPDEGGGVCTQPSVPTWGQGQWEYFKGGVMSQ